MAFKSVNGTLFETLDEVLQNALDNVELIKIDYSVFVNVKILSPTDNGYLVPESFLSSADIKMYLSSEDETCVFSFHDIMSGECRRLVGKTALQNAVNQAWDLYDGHYHLRRFFDDVGSLHMFSSDNIEDARQEATASINKKVVSYDEAPAIQSE